MRNLSSVSIFDIKHGLDRVVNIETNQVGTLEIRTSNYGDSIDLYVKWDGSEQYTELNQHNKDLFLVETKVL